MKLVGFKGAFITEQQCLAYLKHSRLTFEKLTT